MPTVSLPDLKPLVREPWKALVGVIVFGTIAYFLFHSKIYSGACAVSVLTGMYFADWAHRLGYKRYWSDQH